MKSILIIAGVILCIILIVVLIGCTLPVKHTASVKVIIDSTPDKVWQRLTDFEQYPAWRNDVKSVELVSDDEWIEINSYGKKLPLRITSREPMIRLSTQIKGTGLPFGGDWEFKLQPEGNKTLVTITENGEIYSPVFRFVSRFLIGYSATAKKYGNSLQQSFIKR